MVRTGDSKPKPVKKAKRGKRSIAKDQQLVLEELGARAAHVILRRYPSLINHPDIKPLRRSDLSELDLKEYLEAFLSYIDSSGPRPK